MFLSKVRRSMLTGRKEGMQGWQHGWGGGVQKGGDHCYIFAHADITETVTCAEWGEGVQRYTQRWHREELRRVQKGEMRRTERGTGTERWGGGYRDIRRDVTESS